MKNMAEEQNLVAVIESDDANAYLVAGNNNLNTEFHEPIDKGVADDTGNVFLPFF
jgi:hypothetical protein